MCRHLILVSSIETIENRFGVTSGARLEWQPPTLVAPGNQTLIITQEYRHRLTLSEFGMTPAWAKAKMMLLNARAEGDKNPNNDPHFSGAKAIFMKSAFKRPLFSQRCAVIADAYIAFSSLKKPWLVHLQNKERPFAMAGIYDTWLDPVSSVQFHTFAIITVPGNLLVRQLPSARMPVIIHPSKVQDWLRASNCLSEILLFLRPYPSDLMKAYPVTADILTNKPFSRGMLLPTAQAVSTLPELKPLPQRHYTNRPKLMGYSSEK